MQIVKGRGKAVSPVADVRFGDLGQTGCLAPAGSSE